MTNKEREQIIEIALRDYNIVVSESRIIKQRIINAVNMMENAYIMCSMWNVKNIEKLRQTIIKAKSKYDFV